ncbi:MAG: sigma-54-dependent Fis family transcriptional regulator [Kiritimatiellae bacterium]|nr:sigma-54-dependent Fis family transcriptional regulator [Kiritimatiellia bacterium]
METALVADDDALMREFVVETLTRNDIETTEVSNGLEAKRLLEDGRFDLAFLDLKMPGLNGMQVLKSLEKEGIETLPVVITAFGTVEKAVDAMKMGAYDFLMKPFSPEQVELIIKRAKELVTLQAENAYLKEELGWKLPQGRQIIGQSRLIADLMKSVERVANASSSVLISGESGTGKELVALAIHSLSERRNQPFIRMNCAAVPATLMDSELFGHERGAFTSAVARRIGRFELANKGTLLLDEVSEIPLGMQAKLLRVLQEQEFERVGGSHTIKTDSRIVATTNRDLTSCVEKGEFRQDLFFRLNVVPIHVPPLRERREDVPVLAKAFLDHNMKERTNGRKRMELRFDEAAMHALTGYAWPGNVRELKNLVERLCVMEEGPELGLAALPAEIRNGHAELPKAAGQPAIETLSIPEMERRTILRALESTGGNRKRSAELLQISIRTLRNKLNQYREKEILAEPMP